MHDAWNSDHLKRIRSDLLSGIEAPECSNCFNTEKLGKKSLRQSTFEKAWTSSIDINNPKIKFVDVRFSNECNLKCLSCHSSKSNQIGLEEGLTHPTKTLDIYNSLTDIASDLEEINFSGGEPLLHKDMYRLLDYLIVNGYSKNIRLKFSTNSTIFKEEFINIIQKFKAASIHVSIDNYGKRNEYIRFPSQWNSIERNFKNYEKNLPGNSRLIINQVVSNLSIVGIKEFYDWHNMQNFNFKFINHTILQKPLHLRCHIIPNNVKNSLIKDLQHIPKLKPILPYVMQPYSEEDKNDFIEYIKRKDKLRGVNILDYCPEFEEWFS